MSDFILPEQLMSNIWLRLPIKSTVRFRGVSKSWCSSLSDPEFIYSNLTSFDDAEHEKDLLMVLDRESKIYSVVSHEGQTLVATPLQLSPLPEVPSDDECYPEVVTYCCDDLVCFHKEHGEVVGVWNLTTGETKILPRVSDFQFVTLGFGFDDQIQDYKIVLIGEDEDDVDYEAHVYPPPAAYVCPPPAAYVYCLRSGNNCWRKLEEAYVPYLHCVDYYCRSYRDGKFYWCEKGDTMASFDMSTEVFNVIRPLPPHRIEKIEKFCKLKEGAMLIISCTYSNPQIDLWALLEVGVSSSLTKLFTIDWDHGLVTSLGFWRNELVCQRHSNNRFFIAHPFSQREHKEVEIDKTLSCQKLYCFAWTKGKNSVPLNSCLKL